MSSRLTLTRRYWNLAWVFSLCFTFCQTLHADEYFRTGNHSSAYFQPGLYDNPFAALQASCQSCAPQNHGCAPSSMTPAPGSDFPSPYSAPNQPFSDPSTSATNFPTAPGGLAMSSTSIIAASNAAAGYIDLAVPVTQFRLRYDAAYGTNRPDRAEFFYPKCGCFMTPDAKGPVLPETNIDYQEIRPYFELATSDRFSIFGEFPVRFINPEVNANEAGFGDIVAGFKYALIAEDDEYFTFQLKTYSPTGVGREGLGTEHVSLEPGLLYYSALSDRASLQAELRDWIPIGGSNFAGNVLRYGVGLGYTTHRTCDYSVTPIAEFVGWTVLDGAQTNLALPGAVEDATGDTIVNVKLGVRVGFGGQSDRVFNYQRNSVYIGYGRAMTGDVWYEDILRLEYRLLF